MTEQEMMVEIRLSVSNYKNLLAFLDRTPVNGVKEAALLVGLVQDLNKNIKEVTKSQG